MGSGREYGVKTVQITEREHLSCSLKPYASSAERRARVVDAQVLEEARRARWRRVATVAEDDPAGERRG